MGLEPKRPDDVARGRSLAQARVLWGLAGCISGFDVVVLSDRGAHGVIIGAGFMAAIAGLIELDVLLRHPHAEGNVARSTTRIGRVLVGSIVGLSIAGAALATQIELGGSNRPWIKAILFAVFGAMIVAGSRALGQNSPRRIGTLSVVAAACATVVGTVELFLGPSRSSPVVFSTFRVAFAFAIVVGLWSTSRWRRKAPAIAGPVAKARLRG